jgi:hypothetical protein
VRERIEARELDVSVDSTSLAEYIARSLEVASLVADALKAGFSVEVDDLGPGFGTEIETIGKLAAVCQHLQIDTLLVLEHVLVSAREWSPEYFQGLIRASRKAGRVDWEISRAFAVELVVLASFHNVVMVEDLKGWGFGGNIAKRVLDVALQVRGGEQSSP